MINTGETLKKYDFSIQKKYGQNFLKDSNILEGIVEAAGVRKDDVVLEIGPGLGVLTELLCQRARHVISVEIDRMLIPILEDVLKDYNNLTLVNADILKTDIDRLIAQTEEKIGGADKDSVDKNGTSGKRRIKVVANLPYYITTPIIMELLEKQNNIKSITVMVQKEVAERMQEGVGTKAYGALSLAVQYYSRPELVMTVSRNCFIPRPEVDSAVITLNIYEPDERPVKTACADEMFKIIRAAFNQRRKTLVNALSNAGNLSYSKEQIASSLEEIGKPAAIRGEALTLEEFAKLSEKLTG